MSFILDALRKSEHERQRGAVPGISHVPLAVPRREVPAWVFGVIGVLALAVVGLGGAWWLSSRESPETPAAAAVAPRNVPLDVPPRAPAPPLRAPEPAARPAVRTAAPETGTAPSPALPEPAVTQPAPRTFDEQPITARVAPPPPAPVSSEPPLPSASALAAEGIAVPPLRLELHAFSDTPAQRFVFINGTRYREGETLREGPRLLSIERNGAVLSHQGRRFMLAPQ